MTIFYIFFKIEYNINMKTKIKFIILNSILVFFIAFLGHFIYEISENNIFAIFFPVNESIWEHMKLLFTPYIIDILIIYLISKKFNIVYHNFLFSALFSATFSIFLYLTIYLPIYNIFGHNSIFAIILMYIVIFISQLFQIYILKKEEFRLSKFSFVLIIAIYIIFGYLTYYPIRNYIFYDFNKNLYGKNIYILGN